MANLGKEVIQIVAEALDDNSVSGARKMHIVKDLVEYFDGNGWTGQNEALAEFLQDAWVVEAFKRAGHVYVEEVKKDEDSSSQPGRPAAGGATPVRGRPSRR